MSTAKHAIQASSGVAEAGGQRKVVHDIRNSLNAALMSAELALLLTERGVRNDQVVSALRDIMAHCKLCGELLQGLRPSEEPAEDDL